MMTCIGRLALLVLFCSATACGDDMFAPKGSDASRLCRGYGATVDLVVAPNSVTRGQPVSISVGWRLRDSLSDPVVATLKVEDATVEVEIPLIMDDAAVQFTYGGSILNPFGAGTPAGSVSVIGTGGIEAGCLVPPSAVTSFQLF